MDIGLLHASVAAVAPIDGVSVGVVNDKATWEVQFKPEATEEERTAAAAAIAAYDPNAAPAPSFLARDLLAILTVDDAAAVQAAIAGSPALWLLWQALTGQGDAPIYTDSPRFVEGWAGLTAAIGQTRADDVATALGFA